VGAISHHYFAGFGGGRKLLFPGFGEQEAIYHQSPPLSRPPPESWPRLPPGPAGRATPWPKIWPRSTKCCRQYIWPSMVCWTASARLPHTGSVDVCPDFLAACEEHDRLLSGPDTDRLYDLVLASAGGFPKDINLIQRTRRSTTPPPLSGTMGTLICWPNAPTGSGLPPFSPISRWGDGRLPLIIWQAYSGNGGTALAMMTKTDRIRIALVTTLDPHSVSRLVSTLSVRRRPPDPSELHEHWRLSPMPPCSFVAFPRKQVPLRDLFYTPHPFACCQPCRAMLRKDAFI
jgi:lactate racemase